MLPEATADAAVKGGCLLGAMVVLRVLSSAAVDVSLLSSLSSRKKHVSSRKKHETMLYHVGPSTNPTWVVLAP